MIIVKKEVTYRVLDERNLMGFIHPKAEKFTTVSENNESIVSEDDKEAIEILGRAADTFKV